MKKYKKKLPRTFIVSLQWQIVKLVEEHNSVTLYEQLLIAALVEVHSKLEQRLIDVKKEYGISFSPVQAFSIRLLSFYVPAGNPYTANILRQMADEIHQFYS